MARLSQLEASEVALNKAEAGEDISGTGKDIVETIKFVGEAFEGILWIGVFAYFTNGARSIIPTSLLKDWLTQGTAHPDLFISDRTGYGVGPIALTFAPAAWWTSLKILNRHGLNNIVAAFPDSTFPLNSDFERQSYATIRRFSDDDAEAEGYWDLLWSEEDYPIGKTTGRRARFNGVRTRWVPALMFGAVCALVAKGGTALIRAVLP